MRELAKHMVAALVQVIRPVITGVYYSLSNFGGFIRLNSRLRLTQVCTVHTIIRVVELLTRADIEQSICNRFHMLSNTGLSFTILCSCK